LLSSVGIQSRKVFKKSQQSKHEPIHWLVINSITNKKTTKEANLTVSRPSIFLIRFRIANIRKIENQIDEILDLSIETEHSQFIDS
jgi:hypothetical protein